MSCPHCLNEASLLTTPCRYTEHGKLLRSISFATMESVCNTTFAEFLFRDLKWAQHQAHENATLPGIAKGRGNRHAAFPTAADRKRRTQTPFTPVLTLRTERAPGSAGRLGLRKAKTENQRTAKNRHRQTCPPSGPPSLTQRA